MTLTLRILTNALTGGHPGLAQLAEIVCGNAVEYSIRPPHSCTLEGGPRMVYGTTVPALLDPALQSVPGGDGEVFDPPLKLALIILDQSRVIAEKFLIRETG